MLCIIGDVIKTNTVGSLKFIILSKLMRKSEHGMTCYLRYGTGFDKTKLPHASNYLTSNGCNLTVHNANDLETSHILVISS